VVIGLIVAVVAIPVAWATSFLRPPATATARESAVAADA
jgi:DHA1 family inner membrane transport protein